MTLDTLRTHCLAKAGVTEEMPFGPTALVFKVMGKVFLLAGLDSRPLSFSVKCDPERAIDLRERYDAVRPGYHLNKKHWNTIQADGSVPDGTLKTWIDDSYALVVASLPRPLKAELALF